MMEVLQNLAYEVGGALIVVVTLYAYRWRDRHAEKLEKQKLASLITLRLEDLLQAKILPDQFRQVHILSEPTRDKTKLMERLNLISNGITFEETTFLFHFINRLYEELENIGNYNVREIRRVYKILALPKVASLTVTALDAKKDRS